MQRIPPHPTPRYCDACSQAPLAVTAFGETVPGGHDERVTDFLGALRWKNNLRVTGLKMEPERETHSLEAIIMALPTEMDCPQGQPHIRMNNKNDLLQLLHTCARKGKPSIL